MEPKENDKADGLEFAKSCRHAQAGVNEPLHLKVMLDNVG